MALIQSEDARSQRAPLTAEAAPRFWPLGLPVLLGAGTTWLAFKSGGFFAGDTAVAVIVVGLVLLLWMMLAPRPLDALSPLLVVAAGALALFAVWALVSQNWSNSPARAVIESNRILLYLLIVVLFGLAGSLRSVRDNVPRCVAAAFVIVSVCGLITRLLPEVWGVSSTIEFERLSYPTSYWNTAGMLAALGIVICLHLASSGREPLIVRALAAASVPLLASTLLLTFSRGAIGALPVGVIVLLLLSRPARVASALAAIVPPAAVAVSVIYQTDSVSNASGPGAELIADGKTVAVYIAICAIAAAVLVVVLSSLDERVAQMRSPSRPVWAMIATGLVALLIAGGVALDVQQQVSDTVDRLGHVQPPSAESSDNRKHLTSVSDSGRSDQYQVAVHAFDREPLIGTGAGTYPLLYAQGRKTVQTVSDGHSLYLETMAEMGLVGLALVMAAILSLLIGAAVRRRSNRELGSVAFALTFMWALRAGLDWDWEMPALTLPVLALAATALYVPPAAHTKQLRSWPNGLPRLLIGIAILAGLITPMAIARSQAQLNDAVTELRAHECGPAISSALSSADALSIRPEPFQVLAICDLRIGQRTLALNAINAALRRDPDDWRLLYNRAIIRAVVGRDPRPDLRRAQRRNPLSTLLDDARERFDTASPAQWRSRGRRTIVLG